MIDHLSITTTDLDRAQAFYDALLVALGYPRVNRRSEAIAYGLRQRGPDAAPHISVYICTASLVRDNLHWCFRALFDRPDHGEYQVATGTAANVLSLACCPPS